ncbi:hypothetical protein [Qipengyuania sp.]|uniref:hypothetical protein n=1 Tax=Qipengyuania sp. TaxID=2004515 RepID=UPI003BA8EA54
MNIRNAKESKIRRSIGITKKQPNDAVKSWFPDRSIYPTQIHCSEPSLLYKLATFFSRKIVIEAPFNLSQAKREIASMFKIEGINLTEIDRFLVGTAVLLNGRSVEIVPGVQADLSLDVQNPRTIPQDHSGNTGGDYEIVHLLPDGNLSVLASVSNQRGDGLVGVASEFIDTKTDTERFFARSLVIRQDARIPRLDLKRELSFDTSRSRPVS